MQTSGRSYEGWLGFIPLSVLIFLVLAALGGPQTVVNTIGLFANDVMAAAASWLRRF